MSGPAQANGATYEVLSDGRSKFTFRQSWLGDYLGMCAERARKNMAGEIPRVETDSAALGTGVHAGIEYGIQTYLEDHVGLPPTEDMQQIAIETFRSIEIDKWQKYSAKKAEEWILHDVEKWVEHIWPVFRADRPLAPEYHFERCVLADEFGEIWIHGTMDAPTEEAVWDWKTATQEYKAHEKRKAIQPAVYTLIAYLQGFVKKEVIPFRYGVLLHGRQPGWQILEVEKSHGDWNWLFAQLKQAALMVAANLPTWPLNDDGWFCSEKWCEAWAGCRGLYVK